MRKLPARGREMVKPSCVRKTTPSLVRARYRTCGAVCPRLASKASGTLIEGEPGFGLEVDCAKREVVTVASKMTIAAGNIRTALSIRSSEARSIFPVTGGPGDCAAQKDVAALERVAH